MAAHQQVAGTIFPPRAETRPRASTWAGPTVIAVVALASISLHLVLRYLTNLPRIAWQTPLILVLLGGGIPLLVSLTRKLFAGEFGSDHLAGISIVTSAILGQYLVGVIVISESATSQSAAPENCWGRSQSSLRPGRA